MFTSGPQSLAWCPQAKDTLWMNNDRGEVWTQPHGDRAVPGRKGNRAGPEQEAGEDLSEQVGGDSLQRPELSRNTGKSGDEAGREGPLDEGNTAW